MNTEEILSLLNQLAEVIARMEEDGSPAAVYFAVELHDLCERLMNAAA